MCEQGYRAAPDWGRGVEVQGSQVVHSTRQWGGSGQSRPQRTRRAEAEAGTSRRAHEGRCAAVSWIAEGGDWRLCTGTAPQGAACKQSAALAGASMAASLGAIRPQASGPKGSGCMGAGHQGCGRGTVAETRVRVRGVKHVVQHRTKQSERGRLLRQTEAQAGAGRDRVSRLRRRQVAACLRPPPVARAQRGWDGSSQVSRVRAQSKWCAGVCID